MKSLRRVAPAGLRLAVVSVALGGLACDSSPPANVPSRTASASPKSTSVPDAGSAKTAVEEVYGYSGLGKRDPFRSPLDDLIIPRSEEGRCPLCRWDMDQLRLVAVVTGTGNPVAMVEDPDGVGHLIHQGTAVGKGNGKVTAIGRDQVVVTETGHDAFGKLLANKLILKIDHPQVEGSPTSSLLDE